MHRRGTRRATVAITRRLLELMWVIVMEKVFNWVTLATRAGNSTHPSFALILWVQVLDATQKSSIVD